MLQQNTTYTRHKCDHIIPFTTEEKSIIFYTQGKLIKCRKRLV